MPACPRLAVPVLLLADLPAAADPGRQDMLSSIATTDPPAEGLPGGETSTYLIMSRSATQAAATAALPGRGVRLLGSSAREAR